MPKITNAKKDYTKFSRYDPTCSSHMVDSKKLLLMEKNQVNSDINLHKNPQNILNSISTNVNFGKTDLRFENEQKNNDWDYAKENDNVEVTDQVDWLDNHTDNNDDKVFESIEEWLIEKVHPEYKVLENHLFCDKAILENIFKQKDILHTLPLANLQKARCRANPFESVRSVFFMNRAALKMANIDAATNFAFTNVENKHHGEYPIYFADVCAGPGGFTEYILWRKKWHYKGFGFTLKADNDFNISASSCASAATFQPLYGEHKDGDVYKTKNIRDFRDRVKHETDSKGVHFMMSDGGFSVDGKEDLQEILSKRIYTCQCLVALEILRPHGYFVTKLFDTFTLFSVGLLYLMFLCFEKIAIIKPVTSRPANSERYFICYDFKNNNRTKMIRSYIWKIVKRFEQMANELNSNEKNRDIMEIVPTEILQSHQSFYNYICNSNNRIGEKQILALRKLIQFTRNPTLNDKRQFQLRNACLEYWKIPNNKKEPLKFNDINERIRQLNIDDDILNFDPYSQHINSMDYFTNLERFHYCSMSSSYDKCKCYFFVALENSTVYKLCHYVWKRVRKLYLPPGTVLYAEYIKENCKMLNSEKIQIRYGLHIIDALYLGNENIQTEAFEKRLELINIFCKSVNQESQTKPLLRIRPKQFHKLIDLLQDTELESSNQDYNLPLIGYKSVKESYEVNSILIIPNNIGSQLKDMLGIQILTDNDGQINLNSLSEFIKNKLLSI